MQPHLIFSDLVFSCLKKTGHSRSVQVMLLFVMLFKDALISLMIRHLPTKPQTPNPGLASQSSPPSHRCRERGILLLGGSSQSSSPSHWQNAAAEKEAYSFLEDSMLDQAFLSPPYLSPCTILSYGIVILLKPLVCL